MALVDEMQLDDIKKEFSKLSYDCTNLMQKDKNNVIGNGDSSANKEALLISSILANNLEYFEMFFQIMNLEVNELNNKTWSILTQLPVNKKLYEEVRSLCTVEQIVHW